MSDALLVPEFFAPATTAMLLAQLRTSETNAATVYGVQPAGVVAPRIRRASLLVAPDEIRTLVRNALLDRCGAINEHFSSAITICEEPQFLRYQTGDFFVAHQDGNTPLLRDPRADNRIISVVVFLSEPADHDGGALLLHEPYPSNRPPTSIAAAAGSAIFFRAETTHEVTPITRGERYTIASWYR